MAALRGVAAAGASVLVLAARAVHVCGGRWGCCGRVVVLVSAGRAMLMPMLVLVLVRVAVVVCMVMSMRVPAAGAMRVVVGLSAGGRRGGVAVLVPACGAVLMPVLMWVVAGLTMRMCVPVVMLVFVPMRVAVVVSASGGHISAAFGLECGLGFGDG